MPLSRHSANFFYFFKKITLPSAPAQALGKEFLDLKKNTLPSAAAQALGKVFLFFIFKNTLPSAPAQTLGKVFFLKVLCRVRQPRHSAKNFWIFLEKTLPSALSMALGKDPENCNFFYIPL